MGDPHHIVAEGVCRMWGLVYHAGGSTLWFILLEYFTRCDMTQKAISFITV